MTTGTFRSDDTTATRTSKRAIGLKKQNNNFARASRFFLYILLPFVHDYGVKMPNLAFYVGRKQATTKFYFSFWTWTWFLEIQLLGGLPTFDKDVDRNNRDEDWKNASALFKRGFRCRRVLES